MSCINEWFALSLISARDQPGRRRRTPRGQSGRRRRYHSIARVGHRRRSSTGSSGTAGIVAGVRGAAPAGVRTPTSPILHLAERELFRHGLSERLELDSVNVEEADELRWRSAGDPSPRDCTFDLGYRTLKFARLVLRASLGLPISPVPLTLEHLELLTGIYLFLLNIFLFEYIYVSLKKGRK